MHFTMQGILDFQHLVRSVIQYSCRDVNFVKGTHKSEISIPGIVNALPQDKYRSDVIIT